MTDNPYEPVPPQTPSDTAQREVPPIGPRASAWRGAKSGMRIAGVVSGLLASILILPALAVTAFGFGSGRGLAFSSYVPVGIGIFLFFTAFGGLIGGTLALMAAFVQRPRPVAAGAVSLSADDEVSPAHTADKPAGSPKKRYRRRRWPWFVGIPLLLILVAAGIIGAYVGRLVDRRLAAAIAAADQDDPNWRLADLLAHREAVPESLNSAARDRRDTRADPRRMARAPHGESRSTRPRPRGIHQAVRLTS